MDSISQFLNVVEGVAAAAVSAGQKWKIMPYAKDQYGLPSAEVVITSVSGDSVVVQGGVVLPIKVLVMRIG